MDFLKQRLAICNDKKWAFITSLIFILLLSLNLSLYSNSMFTVFKRFHNAATPDFVDSKATSPSSNSNSSSSSSKSNSTDTTIDVPKLAYLISGSKGDLDKLLRTLRVLYHPYNVYVVHIDLESPIEERLELARRVANDSMYAKVGNVFVIEKANMVTYRGPTMVANTLHACAILLMKSQDWDWFINLSSSDYPLVTQDDLLYSLSNVPRNLSFVEHTSDLKWKNEKRAMPIIVDPGLYMNTKSDLYYASPNRQLPTAFKLFTGSAWTMLSRSFVEYCIIGYDNLPRTLLMYYTNFLSTPEGYFQTVICNTEEYSQTVVNHDLHYIAWDRMPGQHPHWLRLEDFEKMVESNVPFARKFEKDDPVLDKIDGELLGRTNGDFVPGGWCGKERTCEKVKNAKKLRPGKGALRLGKLLHRIVRSEAFKDRQCI